MELDYQKHSFISEIGWTEFKEDIIYIYLYNLDNYTLPDDWKELSIKIIDLSKVEGPPSAECAKFWIDKLGDVFDS